MFINKIRPTSKNIKKFIIVFFVSHFILQFVFMIVGFGSTMALFDNPDDQFLKIRNTAYNSIFNILSFPFVYIFSFILIPLAMARFPNILEWFGFLLPFIANSLLWSAGFYFLLKIYIKTK